MKSKKFEELMRKMTRDVRLKISLASIDNIIEPLSGYPISGQISMVGDSAYRRVGNLSLLMKEPVKEKLEESDWFNKDVFIEIGLNDPYMGEIVWESLGYFVTVSVQFSFTQDGLKADFQFSDPMSFLDGSISGAIGTKVEIIAQSTDLETAFKKVASQIGKVDVREILIDGAKAKLPYTIQQEPGSSTYELLRTIVQLYKGYEFFYDRDRFLRFQKIKDKETDFLSWDFRKNDFTMRAQRDSSIENIKNSSIVWGRITDLGEQIYWRYRNRFLRKNLTKIINPDYEIIDIPFTYELDLERGDICHVKDPISAKERLETIDGELLCSPPENYKDRFLKRIEDDERSYVWTNYFNYTEILTPDSEGGIRLSRWASTKFDIFVESVEESEKEILIEKDMSKAAIGEKDSRYFKIKDFSYKIENEQGIPVEGVEKEFTFTRLFIKPSEVKVFIDDKQIFTGFSATNRDSKGKIFFEEVPEGVVSAEYEWREVGGEPYLNPVKVTYEYETDKYYWVELDFLVIPEFRIEEIGERVRSLRDDISYTNTQAKLYSEYSLWNSSNFAESISISCVPIYTLEPNQKISLEMEELGLKDEYLINSIDMPLGQGEMSIRASKIFNNNVRVPDSRNPLPNAAPDCSVQSVVYPDSFDRVYIYNTLEKTYEIKDGASLPTKIFPSLLQIEELEKRILEIPFDSETEKELFISKADFIFSSLVFTSNQELEAFMTLYIDQELIYKTIQEAPTSSQIGVDESGVSLINENIHYAGKYSGYQTISVDLGRGNTFDKLLAYQKEEPPKEYFDRYLPLDCEEAWKNYPLEETSLPERPYSILPSKETFDYRTNGFLRSSDRIFNFYRFFPHEYNVKIKVISHFCANLRKAFWELIREGKVEEPTEFPQEQGVTKPIVREDIVYLGEIPTSDLKISFNLGMGNTKDKIEIIYQDQPVPFLYEGVQVYEIEHDPSLNNWNSLQGYLLLDWNPVNNITNVIIRVTSSEII